MGEPEVRAKRANSLAGQMFKAVLADSSSDEEALVDAPAAAVALAPDDAEAAAAVDDAAAAAVDDDAPAKPKVAFAAPAEPPAEDKRASLRAFGQQQSAKYLDTNFAREPSRLRTETFSATLIDQRMRRSIYIDRERSDVGLFDSPMEDVRMVLEREAANESPSARRRGERCCFGLLPAPPLVQPDSKLHVRWDVAQVFFLAYVATMVPVRVAFEWPALGLFLWLELLIDVYFWLDIVVNFLTVVHIRKGFELTMVTDRGRGRKRANFPTSKAPLGRFPLVLADFGTSDHVSERRGIAWHYARTWFLLDLVACLPVGYAYSIRMYGFKELKCNLAPPLGCGRASAAAARETSGSALRLVKLLRIFRLLKLVRLARLSRLFEKYEDEMMYVMGFLQGGKLVFVLVYASHWMGCCYALVFKFTRGEVTVLERYVTSVYWAMQTITTVGYGDLQDTTINSQIFSILCMAIGGAARVRKQNSRQYVDRDMLGALPKQLRVEIYDYLRPYRDTILVAPIFSGCRERFVNHICIALCPITFPVGDHVYDKGDVAEEGMYIISKGDVAMRYTESAAPWEEPGGHDSDDSFMGRATVSEARRRPRRADAPGRWSFLGVHRARAPPRAARAAAAHDHVRRPAPQRARAEVCEILQDCDLAWLLDAAGDDGCAVALAPDWRDRLHDPALHRRGAPRRGAARSDPPDAAAASADLAELKRDVKAILAHLGIDGAA
ncbi:voltage-gated potassium channel [Aureococcus anophagefferens]|nr:voltage-gated potassium channel [Aureococcus anophagefferens]